MGRRPTALLAAALLASVACGRRAPLPTAEAMAGPVTLETDDEKTLYALGVFHGQNLRPLNLSPAELELV
jgi:predicted small lipoprotein YifL